MNGLFLENILVRENDDIFIPFPYELMNDVPDKSPIELKKNVIIDSRYDYVLWKEILKHSQEVLIYNTTRHVIVNVYQYLEDVFGIHKMSISMNKIRKFVFLMLLIKFSFKELHVKPDVKYILDNIDDTEFQSMSILINIIFKRLPSKNSSKITSKEYAKMKSKVLSYEILEESPQKINSFIILFSSESFSI